jgi:hypothetical protein
MGGLSLYHHICSCSPEPKSSTSIIIEKNCCSSINDDFGNCHASKDCNGSECNQCSCETEVKTLTVDKTILVDNIKIEINRNELLLNPVADFLQLTENDNSKILFSTENDESPPKQGKQIVILHQSLKIPPHTS